MLRELVGFQVGAVDFAGLFRHVGEHFERVFVRLSQRRQPLLEADLVLFREKKKKKKKLQLNKKNERYKVQLDKRPT